MGAYLAKAQAHKSSVKTVVYYVGCSHHHMIKSGIVTHTQADEVVCKEVAKGVMVPLKPWIAVPGISGVPWSTPQDCAGVKPSPANSKEVTGRVDPQDKLIMSSLTYYSCGKRGHYAWKCCEPHKESP